MPPLMVATLIFAAFFGAVWSGRVGRQWAALAGGGAMAVAGILFGFYSGAMVADAVYGETLALIFGMSLIAASLARGGVFGRIAGTVARMAEGNSRLVLILFMLLTYTLSLAVNNLATVVVLLPVALRVCWSSGLNPVPLTIGMVVASNLGGASTMVGDFPNMIIASVADLTFLDFIGGMMVPCLLLLAATLLYFERAKGGFHAHATSAAERKVRLGAAEELSEITADERFYTRLGLGALTLALVGFLATDATTIRPSVVALAIGMGVVFLGQWDPRSLFDAVGGGDILFFVGLFVMVGGVNAAGGLEWLDTLIERAGQGKASYELALLMWIAGGATILLNAGPSTAFFIPVATEMSYRIPGDAVWWALSLGVLAGSSAALTGATAGSVAVSQLERSFRDYPGFAALVPAGGTLDFKEYLRWGFPLMALFLALSTPYILLMAPN
ncbi:MAG: anion permease [Nitrospinae bacterium]|nr:anion permease [Nitrospinota bacterium]